MNGPLAGSLAFKPCYAAAARSLDQLFGALADATRRDILKRVRDAD